MSCFDLRNRRKNLFSSSRTNTYSPPDKNPNTPPPITSTAAGPTCKVAQYLFFFCDYSSLYQLVSVLISYSVRRSLRNFFCFSLIYFFFTHTQYCVFRMIYFRPRLDNFQSLARVRLDNKKKKKTNNVHTYPIL